MKLRTRLVVVTVAVTVPMIVLLLWLDARARHRAAAYVLGEVTARLLQSPNERARCEADPRNFGRLLPFGPSRSPHDADPFPRLPPAASGVQTLPGAQIARSEAIPPVLLRPPPIPIPIPIADPPVLYVYDDQRVPTDNAAPALSEDLIAALGDEQVHVLPRRWFDEGVDVLVRTPWGTGPCTYILAHGRTTPGFLGALLPAGWIWLAPVGALMIAILLAVGPVIARIRRLTAAVNRSAARGFTEDVAVEGSDEVKQLAAAFGAATREVRAQLAAKDQREQSLRDFLANTTHDVMIPLTVLQAHLDTLRLAQGSVRRPDPQILTAAMDEAHYIGALLHNLALAAKLDAGKPAMLTAPVELDALVARVVGRHAPIARQRGVTLEHAVPEHALVTSADVTMLEQAVSNLVYNAIRHNRTNGHVAIIVEPIATGRFRIRVLDDGPGIPAADLSRLMERGQRGGDARTRDPEGRGLGLDIIHRVAALHGYDLTFSPSEFGGLQVDLEGPLAAP